MYIYFFWRTPDKYNITKIISITTIITTIVAVEILPLLVVESRLLDIDRVPEYCVTGTQLKVPFALTLIKVSPVTIPLMAGLLLVWTVAHGVVEAKGIT